MLAGSAGSQVYCSWYVWVTGGHLICGGQCCGLGEWRPHVVEWTCHETS